MTSSRMVLQSLRSMSRYKARTAFMMLGSLVGVAALTLAVSVGQAVQGAVRTTVGRVLGDASVVVLGAGSRTTGSPRAGAARLTLDDMEAVVRDAPGIAVWDPQAEITTTIRRGRATGAAGATGATPSGATGPSGATPSGATASGVRILGESERWQQAWSRGVSRGESFDVGAVNGSARVALIGQTAARALFAYEDPIGAEIRIDGVPFRVIGVLEAYGTDMHGMDRDNEIVVPITTLMRRLANTDAITAAKLVVSDPSSADATAAAATRILRERHALNRDQPDDFMILTPSGVRKMVGTIQRILLLYVPLVAGIVLLVGAVVAATLMLASVNGRVSEIGLRRAVGARPEDIRRQFIVETATTVVAGGLAGIVLAFIGYRIVGMHMNLGGASLSWTAVALGLLASAVTGLVAGVVPAQRAAGLDPIQALK